MLITFFYLSLADPSVFAATCSTLLARMIDTVPAGVKLTDEIDPLPYKVSTVQLQPPAIAGEDTMILNVTLRVSEIFLLVLFQDLFSSHSHLVAPHRQPKPLCQALLLVSLFVVPGSGPFLLCRVRLYSSPYHFGRHPDFNEALLPTGVLTSEI